MSKFVESGWDLISIPAKEWLENKNQNSKKRLIEAILQAD